MENLPLSALVDRLKSERRVCVRLAAVRPETDWQAALLDITVGPSPPRWRRQTWLYPRAAFIASTRAGSTVARWFAKQQISIGSVSLGFELHNSVNIERRDSRFVGLFEPLEWSSWNWTVSIQGQHNTTVHDALVADDAPTFYGFQQAASSFFAVAPTTGNNFSGQQIVVREQDESARIDSVRVRPTELVVHVSGNQLHGTYLSLSGDGAARKRLSARTKRVRLPLPTGLEQDAWLALHRDQQLLDRKVLDRQFGGADDGVEVEIDSATRAAVLVSNGEQPNVEFKSQLPDNPHKAMKTVAAFANGAGGSVVFGVDDEDHTIIGLGDAYTHQMLDRLTNLITDWVRPLPHFRSAMVEINGKGVIVLDIAPGDEPPYGVGTDERNVQYYVRRGATTFPASPSNLRALIQARAAAEPPLYFPGAGRRRRL